MAIDALTSWYDPAIDTTTYTYDAAGNLTRDPVREYSHDALGRVTAVRNASTHATVATYSYDHANRRTSVTEGGVTTCFHYDGTSGDVIAETDGAGTTIARYAYDDAGAIVSMTRGGATYYYHRNARGDVVALTDATGAVANSYRYDPYGRLISAGETVDNPYRYASYRHDAATGLYYCWNRYYDPVTARFLTRDPEAGDTAEPATLNPYAYCAGDPVNHVDPEGLLALTAAAGPFVLSGVGTALAYVAAAAGVAASAWAGSWLGRKIALQHNEHSWRHVGLRSGSGLSSCGTGASCGCRRGGTTRQVLVNQGS